MNPQMFGRYLLLDKVAAGGMAEVLLCKRVGPGGFTKQIALKRMLPEIASDQRRVEMFIQEARIAARWDASVLALVPGETAAAATKADACENPKATFEECERAWQRHAAGMPGGVQLVLNAGDFALYRAQGWHLGNYHPQRPRATLHHVVGTEKYYRWWRAWIGADKRPAIFEGF